MTQGKYRFLYGIATVLLSLSLSSGFAVWYVSYSNSKWCNELSILTRFDPRQTSTPLTDYGKQQKVQQIASYDSLVHLRKSFRCH